MSGGASSASTSLVIRSVEYVDSVVSLSQEHPGDLPQIAFAGRSNVGKSSLINRLLGRPKQKVARVSATPGKTQTLNFYEVNQTFYLVDLPGSGYAQVPVAVRDAWQQLVEGYLRAGPNKNLKGVVYLVDSRHPPSAGDLDMLAVLSDLAIPTMVALTKIDKLNAKQRSTIYQRVAAPLGLSEDQVVLTSAKSGEGRELILDAMQELLEPDETAKESSGDALEPGSSPDTRRP